MAEKHIQLSRPDKTTIRLTEGKYGDPELQHGVASVFEENSLISLGSSLITIVSDAFIIDEDLEQVALEFAAWKNSLS